MKPISLGLVITALALVGCDNEVNLDGMSADGGQLPRPDATFVDIVGVPVRDAGSVPDSAGNPFFNPSNPGTDADVQVPPDAGAVSEEPISCLDILRTAPFGMDEPCRGPLRWQTKIANGEPQSRLVELAADAAGNLYWMLTLFGHLDLEGHELGNPLGETALLLSYTPDGALRWAFEHREATADALALSADQACLAIYTESAAGLPERLDPEALGYDAIVCLDLDGTPRWSRTLDATLLRVNGMTFDAQGNLYAAGHYQSSLAISSELGAASYDSDGVGPKGDGFVVSYTQDGEPRWLTTIGGPEGDQIHDIAVRDDGRLVITGEDSGGVRAGGEALAALAEPHSFAGGFVAMLSATGAVEWAVRSPETESFAPNEVVLDALGRALVTFELSSTVIAYGETGETLMQYAGPQNGTHPLAAYEGGLTLFSLCESRGQTWVPCVIDADFDFNPRSVRGLSLSGAPEGMYSGNVAVRRLADGSVAAASDWADRAGRYLVMLDPPEL